jgi:hypothetical protein
MNAHVVVLAEPPLTLATATVITGAPYHQLLSSVITLRLAGIRCTRARASSRQPTSRRTPDREASPGLDTGLRSCTRSHRPHDRPRHRGSRSRPAVLAAVAAQGRPVAVYVPAWRSVPMTYVPSASIRSAGPAGAGAEAGAVGATGAGGIARQQREDPHQCVANDQAVRSRSSVC